LPCEGCKQRFPRPRSATDWPSRQGILLLPSAQSARNAWNRALRAQGYSLRAEQTHIPREGKIRMAELMLTAGYRVTRPHNPAMLGYRDAD